MDQIKKCGYVYWELEADWHGDLGVIGGEKDDGVVGLRIPTGLDRFGCKGWYKSSGVETV